jgi:hypothetical protein
LTSRFYLRSAAVLTLIHCLGHTARTMLSAPADGSPQMLVIRTMKAYSFNFSGFEHSYWDFYRGFGWFLAVQLAVQAIVFWYLASWAKSPSPQLRPILLTFAVNFVAMAILSFRYFTLGPIVIEMLIAACFVGGIVTIPSEGIHSK